MKNLRKLLITISCFLLLMTASGITVFAAGTAAASDAPAVKEGWIKRGSVYKWRQADGTILKEKGWHILGGKKYYLYGNGVRKTGWFTDESGRYYLSKSTDPIEHGAVYTGLQVIGGKTYYFAKRAKVLGQLRKGLVRINGKCYYFDPNAGGAMVKNKWITIGGSKYYFGPNGYRLKSGSHLIDGKYYIFNTSGQLIVPGSTGIVQVGTKKFYLDAGGNPVPGWVMIGDKAYYVKKNGKCVANTTVEGVKLTKDGSASNTAQVQCKLEARKFIQKHAANKTTNYEKLRACFNYILAYQKYRPGHNPKGYPNENWQYTGAVDMFTSNLTGNCYGFACTVAAVAKELGYQPYIITTTGDHGFVMINGKYYDNMYGGQFGTSTHRAYTIKQKIAV